jgi:DNA-binding transcriptional LysR family regulator
MMSMRALECLVTITEQGSLTQAAAVLHLSQPTLSHQIAAIERELGTPVIERLPRGIRPTAAGLAAAAEARVALAAADRAVMAGKRVAAGTGGRIRIACVETMTAWVLVPVLRAWQREYPDVELDLKEYTSADRMLDVLLAGGTDLTVGPRPTRAAGHIEILGQEEIVVVAAAGASPAPDLSQARHRLPRRAHPYRHPGEELTSHDATRNVDGGVMAGRNRTTRQWRT